MENIDGKIPTKVALLKMRNQVLQGAIVSGFDRVTGLPVPGPFTLSATLYKGILTRVINNASNEYELPYWQKMALFGVGMTIPYMDKIYCAVAPQLEILLK